ncbi:nucleolar pre-ribosomal-associated protein 2 [Podospora fimiseda]|uniref:Nucleolar pre-ribosomal-associated protein 2 n=1 Tax=Podospora fimiseda TaxID=252190 RepID=A0AAN7BQV9_9PEZI|nr:nucleolar pre-ribosomal-associated protein 2 [Podospora fimiseda]
MEKKLITTEYALLSSVRALDQGDVETIPERLERVWDIISEYNGGYFHATEEMLLRWLLKNMTGSTANAERLRRYPRAWDILRKVFVLIIPYSLAKSLADRRFTIILQQTLKEIAQPQQETAPTNDEESDVEMTDAPSPASPSVSFNLSTQKSVQGCLQTAEAVFEALRTLLARCDFNPVGREHPHFQFHRMGGHHIKSMFYTSSTEMMELMVPMLTLCDLAIKNTTPGPLKGQSWWLSTFGATWDLHQRGPRDAAEVATHLSLLGTRLLGKLTGVPQQISLTIEPLTQERWAKDLRRFLARNLILPGRAAFLNRKAEELVQVAVEISSISSSITFPVLFDLVSGHGGNTSIKDHESWAQSVFDHILKASKRVSPPSNGLAAIRSIMDMAVARNTVLTISSLRRVCKEYALRKNEDDWDLLLSIVKLNPDVFLLSDEGKELLDQILDKTQKSELLSEGDFEKGAKFVVLLADGYAQAREVPTLIKTWYKYLAPSNPKDKLQPLWAQEELAKTFARFLQSSLTSDQLAGLVGWLSVQKVHAAKIHILAAISRGISQEAYIDAVNMAVFDGVFAEKISKKDSPAVSACRWNVAEITLRRVTVEEAGKIWERVGSDLEKTLRNSPMQQEDTFAAFRCCVSMWLANYTGAKHEKEAAGLACSFVERLEKDSETIMEVEVDSAAGTVTKEAYIEWIFSGWPQLVALFVKKTGQVPKVILSAMKPSGAEDSSRIDIASKVSDLVCNVDSIFDNLQVADALLDAFISLIDTSIAGRGGRSTNVGIRSLLAIPFEALRSNHRGAAMKALVAHLPGESDKAEAIGVEYWRSVLALMVKLMGRPARYEGMSFKQLEAIGRCLLAIHKRSNRGSRDDLITDEVTRDLENFEELELLTTLTIRQMASGTLGDFEKTYLSEAISILRNLSWSSSDAIVSVVLLRAFVSEIEKHPHALKQLQESDLEIDSLINNDLLQGAATVVTSGKWRGKKLVSLLLALSALDGLDRAAVQKAVAEAVPSLLETSNTLIANDVSAGWKVRMFLANHFPQALGSPFKITMHPSTSNSDNSVEQEASVLNEYTNTVARAADEATKLLYLKELLLGENDGESRTEYLRIIGTLIRHLRGSKPSESTASFDLSQVHNALCRKLERTTSPAHFLLLAEAIESILVESPACMTQWNIDLTLSTVAVIGSHSSMQVIIAASPIAYAQLSNLVEVVIKRHRKRLDGHFHIFLGTLQALLRLLLARPYDASNGNITAPHPVWEKDARHFSRLLTLICEPINASVSRSNSNSKLESDKDRAKKYVGQYMYLVIMQYIKLQLECVVPHVVREALEKGVFSIVSITSRGGLKIMTDGMDQSGRAVFKELYAKYEKFGKWSGV